FAKEEMYAALALGDPQSLLVLGVLVIGNALLGAAALVVAVKPFFGPFIVSPKRPHEAPLAMLAGPLLFGILGILGGFAPGWLAEYVLSPAGSAIAGAPLESHLAPGIHFLSPAFFLSVVTWAIAALAFW